MQKARVAVRHLSGAAVAWSPCTGRQAVTAVPVGLT